MLSHLVSLFCFLLLFLLQLRTRERQKQLPLKPKSIATIANNAKVDFGLHGKYFAHKRILCYEVYLTNRFKNNGISNSENLTLLDADKSDLKKFEECNSGLTMFRGKIAFRNHKIAELGISYLTGVFNKWKHYGLVLNIKRSPSAVAIDFNTSLFKNRINFVAEVANVFVYVPKTDIQSFGIMQLDCFIDIIGTVMQSKVFGLGKLKLNLSPRLEYADYNVGAFS